MKKLLTVFLTLSLLTSAGADGVRSSNASTLIIL